MKRWVSDIRIAASLSTCVAGSLLLLEYVNTQGFGTDGFPAVLFGVLWSLAFVLVLLIVPIVRNVRSGVGSIRNPAVFILQTALAIVIVVVLANIVIDQAPCFMGVPNCD